VLGDFGLSQFFEGENDSVKNTRGTPFFFAPEQASRQKAMSGRQIDIWCMGVTFYYIATGKFPFIG
jgi:calcium/calmodulin-dependent protein kinase kinase 1